MYIVAMDAATREKKIAINKDNVVAEYSSKYE
jgi:hypothetical protein